jgi:anaerobic magnesium-protoporphyrin IX monomethyl ester cyclase
MKILFITLPIRNQPTSYPPLGITQLVDFLEENGYQDIDFFDIDAFRPNEQEILDRVQTSTPDVIGISAVVSTSYSYLKYISKLLKLNFPKVELIVGGNMAASANVILTKCPIDICVVSDGEIPLLELMAFYQRYGSLIAINKDLKAIKGLVFRDSQARGGIHFTGYASQNNKNLVRQPNYEFLKKHSKIENYIRPFNENNVMFCYDSRSKEAHRKGKNIATVVTSKGCVNRCTFCHRWPKGYNTGIIDDIISYMKFLKERYNVGFFEIADENFGSKKTHVANFIKKVKELDVLWSVAGMRVTTIKENLLIQMKGAGCTSAIFGMESGSPKMLKIMEKRTTLEDNFKALELLREAKLVTIIQLVIGMPGEDSQTIQENIDFCIKALPYLVDPLLISINYAQALPGTPLYEFARHRDLIGSTINEEEDYLLKISDINASSTKHYLNFTSNPLFEVLQWQRMITWKMNFEALFNKALLHPSKDFEKMIPLDSGGYFNLSPLRKNRLVSRVFQMFGNLFFKAIGFKEIFGIEKNVISTIRMSMEKRKNQADIPEISLREILLNVSSQKEKPSTLDVLRLGR